MVDKSKTRKPRSLGDTLFLDLANAVAAQIVQERPIAPHEDNLVLTGRIMGAICTFFEEGLPDGVDAKMAVELISSSLHAKAEEHKRKSLVELK